jgi:hypothetical protein
VSRAATVVVALGLALAATAVAPAPVGATTLVNETFSHPAPDNPNWLVGGMVGTSFVDPCLTAGTNRSQTPIPDCPANQAAIPAGGDPNGQGALRLTSDTGDDTGFVLYQDALPFTAGLDVTFSFYDYDTIPTFVSTGADGVSFFLADGSKPLTTPGASAAASATPRPPIRSPSMASSAATSASGSTSTATSVTIWRGGEPVVTSATVGFTPTM